MEYLIVYPNDELYHHGILGQKWGVRRYQNYDGTYTRKGLQRYKESVSNYEKAKNEYKKAKESGDSFSISKAKENRRIAKTNLKTDKKQLKLDYRADEGRKLYQQGKAVSDNNRKVQKLSSMSTAAMVIGTAYVQTHILDDRKRFLAQAYITAGAAFLTAPAAVYANSQNKKLRAYYSHSRAKRIGE